MMTRPEMLVRVKELQAVRDSLRTKVELEDDIRRLSVEVDKLEREIAWRNESLLDDEIGFAAAVEAMAKETPSAGEIPSAELQLRRLLFEGTIRSAAREEISMRPGLVYADKRIRDRELETLLARRYPDWSCAEDPPTLTPEHKAVLEDVRGTEADDRPIHLAHVAFDRITRRR